MIRHERVAKCVEHDEAEKRAKRCYKKQRCNFDAPAEKTPAVINQHRKDDRSDQPHVSKQIGAINPPLRINERKVRWPKYFTEIKPNSATRDQQSIHRCK